MAKLNIFCCFLWFTGLSALPIINLDEIPQGDLCPQDSLRNDTIGSCTCLPCPELPTTCFKVLVEIYPGDGEPGNCCPQYECTDTKPVCNGTNVTYFPDKCTKCESCNHTIPCTQFCDISVAASNCLTSPHETAIAVGETWKENDGCILCRCTDDGERDCQVTECPLVECDRPIRKDGDCCQTCPDEAHFSDLQPYTGAKAVLPHNSVLHLTLPPHISVLQPQASGGPTSGPPTEVDHLEDVSSTTSAGGSSTNANEFSSPVYPDFFGLSDSTTNAEVTSEAVDNIASSEAPLQENNFTRNLDVSSTDSTMASSTDQSTTNGPLSTSEPPSVSYLGTWTSQIPAETINIEQKSTPEPEPLTPESTSQIKEPSEEKVPGDAKNNTEHLPYMPQERLNTLWWIWPVLIAFGLTACIVVCCVRPCKGGKKVNCNYHEVPTKQTQEVRNLKCVDDPHRK